jgi:hypothetical protein
MVEARGHLASSAPADRIDVRELVLAALNHRGIGPTGRVLGNARAEYRQILARGIMAIAAALPSDADAANDQYGTEDVRRDGRRLVPTGRLVQRLVADALRLSSDPTFDCRNIELRFLAICFRLAVAGDRAHCWSRLVVDPASKQMLIQLRVDRPRLLPWRALSRPYVARSEPKQLTLSFAWDEAV